MALLLQFKMVSIDLCAPVGAHTAILKKVQRGRNVLKGTCAQEPILIVAIDPPKRHEENIADNKAIRSNKKLLTNISIVDNDRDCERQMVCH